MAIVDVISMAETKKLIDKHENVLSTIKKLFNTKFTEENISQVDVDVQACSEKYSHYLSLAQNGEGLSLSDKELIDDIVNEISVERQNLNQIYQRQKVRERLQVIKQMFFQISRMDTCRSYAANLENQAQDLKKSLEDKCLNSFFQDLLDELEDYIKRIQAARKTIKFAIGIEATTGVLTLGASCASIAVGTAGAIASAGRAVVGGTARAAGGAVGVVGETAGEAAVAMDAGEIAGAAAGNIVRPAVKSLEKAIKVIPKITSSIRVVNGGVGGVAKIKEFNTIAKIKEFNIRAKLKALMQKK